MARMKYQGLVFLALINLACSSEGGGPSFRDNHEGIIENSTPQWQVEIREEILAGIDWGISHNELRTVYTRRDELIESTPGVIQDLSMPLYGQSAIGGFFLGESGLYMIAASLLFEENGRRLNEEEVLSRSGTVFSKLKESYGTPWIDIPWDGGTFVHIWRSQNTFVQFAWDGGRAWGIHYRSLKLDPDIQVIISNLERVAQALRK